MKRFIFLFFFIITISINGLCQNLISNSSFENYYTCPDNSDGLSYCQFWSSFSRTPDYYNTCSVNSYITPPNCYNGFQYPHSGNAYAGFFSFAESSLNNRELIGTQLSSPLSIGQKYFISFYVNLGGAYQPAFSTIASNKMGVKFSNVPYSYSNPAPINNTAHFYSNDIITDTVKWTKISGSFIADSAYSYIIIGNFFDDAHTDTLNLVAAYNSYAYYYIDDVCVSPDSLFCENWLGVKEQSVNKEELTIYPNPSTNQLKVRFNKEPNANATLSIIDITGKTIMQTQTTENEFVFNTEKLARGLYLVKVESEDAITLTKFTKE